MFKERIEERQKARREIEDKFKATADSLFIKPILLMGETLDDYLEQRIETDKVLIGILKDIQGNIASMAELNRSVLAEDTN